MLWHHFKGGIALMLKRDVAKLALSLVLYTNQQKAYRNLALRFDVFGFSSFALMLWHHFKGGIALMLNRDVAALVVNFVFCPEVLQEVQ
jgi:hypothetical protein